MSATRNKPEPIVVPSAAGTVEHETQVLFRPTQTVSGVVEIGETVYRVTCADPNTILFEKQKESEKEKPVVYAVRRWPSGRISCECKDFVHKGGNGRLCKHAGLAKDLFAD